MMKISTIYKGTKRFDSGEGLSRVTMDAKPEGGGLGEAPNPKKLVLYGLAGCTGLDVVTILEKKGVVYDRFEIDVETEQTNTHPRVFKTIHITYRFWGQESDRVHMDRAITLSEKQFCGVSAMLAKTAKVTWALEVNPT